MTNMDDPEDVVGDREDIDDECHQRGLHLVGLGDADHKEEEEHDVDKTGALTIIMRVEVTSCQADCLTWFPQERPASISRTKWTRNTSFSFILVISMMFLEC